MLHAPWNRDSSLSPGKRKLYSTSGLTIERITRAFLNAGGDVTELSSVLTDLLPGDFKLLSSDFLFDTDQNYSFEFYLYIVFFTKDLLCDPEFRYIPEDGGQLDASHLIIERGPLLMTPWKHTGESSVDGYYSLANVTALFVYAEHASPLPPYCRESPAVSGMSITDCTIKLLNAWSPANYQLDRTLLEQEGILISMEYLLHLAFFLGSLLNDCEFSHEALYYGFRQSKSLARAVFLQPDISPAEGIRKWQMRTNNLYEMDFEEHHRSVVIGYNLRPLRQMGCFGLYDASCTRRLIEGASGANRAFLELASSRKVNCRFVSRKSGSADYHMKFWWKPSLNIRRLMVAACLSGVLVLSVMLPGILKSPGRWYVPVTVVIGFSVISSLTAMALYWRSRLSTMYRRFADAQKIINAQLDSLSNRTEELLEERNQLEAKVEERTEELSEALAQVTKLDKAKTNFLANVSHELRTPLTLITVPFDEILQKRWGETLPYNHEMFALVKRNIDRIRNQVNRLLDFTRLDLGTVAFKPVPVELLSYAILFVGELGSFAEKRGLSLTFSNRTERRRIVVSADPGLLESVLLNLLFNAVKFTSEGSIELRFDMEGDELELSVRDSGIGIPLEKQKGIFDRFTQLDDEKTRQFEGSGLGLALVKEITDLHRWDIRVESKEGRGSAFILTMPLLNENTECLNMPVSTGQIGTAESELQIPSGPSQLPSDSTKSNILVVEDNPDMGTVLQNLLRNDYNTYWCREGSEAIELLEDPGRPVISLIICDVMMPGMSGFSFQQKLSEEGLCSDVPFIFLTALDTPEDRIRGLDCGAVDYITKPFNRDELLMKARTLLRSRKSVYLQALRDKEGAERFARMSEGEMEAEDPVDWDAYSITLAESRVVKLLRDGLQDKEIAQELSLSPRTVSTHLSHVYEKTRTQNRVELLQVLYP